MTNQRRVEGKEAFRSTHKNIHQNEIFNRLLQAFGRFQTDARELIKEMQFDKMVGGHGHCFPGFVHFLFSWMISRPTTEIPKEFIFWLLLVLLYCSFISQIIKIEALFVVS